LSIFYSEFLSFDLHQLHPTIDLDILLFKVKGDILQAPDLLVMLILPGRHFQPELIIPMEQVLYFFPLLYDDSVLFFDLADILAPRLHSDFRVALFFSVCFELSAQSLQFDF
jgi:hypothetical protein